MGRQRGVVPEHIPTHVGRGVAAHIEEETEEIFRALARWGEFPEMLLKLPLGTDTQLERASP